MKSFSVIITAGGIGSRMGAAIPKQFVEIAGTPMLMHTLESFYHYEPKAELILTLPAEWMNFWEKLVANHDFTVPHRVLPGGKERYDSIKNALEYCTRPYVMVHDGVRPFVNTETLDRCVAAVKTHPAVIPTIEIKDSLRQRTESTTHSVNRAEYIIVQTPQCFKTDLLKKAYKQDFHPGITDDASLVEQMGVAIYCVEGNERNIKITTPFDLLFAEILLK